MIAINDINVFVKKKNKSEELCKSFKKMIKLTI